MAQAEPMRDIVVFDSKAALSRDAAFRFVGLKQQEASSFQPYTVALAGGSTPETLYELLADAPFCQSITWQNMHLFFGDERCVSPDAPESNYGLANRALISHLALTPRHIHRMPGELSDPDHAARQYEEELQKAFHLEAGQIPRFDLILLGLGPDAHCASLFPAMPALYETKRLVVATPPGREPLVPRLTLTLPVLNNAANVIFLVAGADKAEAVARVLHGPPDPENLPAQSVRPHNGSLTWLLDREAASKLPGYGGATNGGAN